MKKIRVKTTSYSTITYTLMPIISFRKLLVLLNEFLKSSKMASVRSLLLLIIILSFFTSCQPGTPSKTAENSGNLVKSQSQQGLKVNFFLENSGSINGYLSSGSEYQLALMEMVTRVSSNYDVSMNLANTHVYPVKGSPSQFVSRLSPQTIKQGNTSTSDLTTLLQSAIDSASENSVSILITDAIYSVDAPDVNSLLGKLQVESIRTRSQVRNAIKSKDLTTVVVKMSSKFQGSYYPASGGAKKINQARPYYIFLFGSGKSIKSCLEVLDLQSYRGFSEISFFKKPDIDNIQYGLVRPLGAFRSTGSFKVDNHSRNNNILDDVTLKNGELGFYFSIDTAPSEIPLEVWSDIDNYNIDLVKPFQYKVVASQSISRLDPAVKSSFSFHPELLFEVKGKMLPKDLNIKFSIKRPNWVAKTNIDDDSEIVGNETQTLGFEYLFNAISEAYGQEAIYNFQFKLKR